VFLGAHPIFHVSRIRVNPLNAELNPICHLLALLRAHPILHVSRIKVKLHASKVQNTIIFIKFSELAVIFVMTEIIETY
jgi:hypothetical protein